MAHEFRILVYTFARHWYNSKELSIPEDLCFFFNCVVLLNNTLHKAYFKKYSKKQESPSRTLVVLAKIPQ